MCTQQMDWKRREFPLCGNVFVAVLFDLIIIALVIDACAYFGVIAFLLVYQLLSHIFVSCVAAVWNESGSDRN